MSILARCAPVLLAVAVIAQPAHAGPPWISIELPANPHDPATRGALFVVRTYHHGTALSQTISCALEGLVGGERRTVTCQAEPTSRVGVYAVRGAVPERGVWMVVVTGADEHRSATALVEFGADRQVASVRVPTRSAEGGRWSIPIPVSPADVDAVLRARFQAVGRASSNSDGRDFQLAGLGLAALIALGLGARRRTT